MTRTVKKHSLEYLRQQGEKLYVAGKSGYEIAKKLGVTDQTVSNWKKKHNWVEKYEEIHNKKLQELIDTALEKTGETLSDLGEIQKASIKPIKEGSLTPQYFGEATKAYMDSLRLEKEMRQSSINTQFIQDIAKIILEEVSDIDILNRIKVKIMSLMQKDSEKVLALSGGREVLDNLSEEDIATE